MASVFKRGGKNNRGGSYYMAWTDHTGRRRTESARTTDLDTARRIANKREADAALRRDGVIDPTVETISRESKRPITAHLADYRANLEARQNTPKHVRMTCQHIEWVVRQAKIQAAADLTGAGVSDAIAELLHSGASRRTCNSYLRSMKSFSRWLLAEKRIPDDPLTSVRQLNEATDRRRERRAMTPEEIDELLRSANCYTTGNHRLAGPDRAMVYRLAFGTGFRANEIRSLTPESFDLNADPPRITVEAAYSKRRRRDSQVIRSDLAETLRPWLDTKTPNEPVFGDLPEGTARMLRADLAAARSAWINAANNRAEREQREESDFLRYRDREGRVADFHATRHTFISGIVAGNASIKVAQELARHSTSRLTVDRYCHTTTHEVVDALDALPEPKTKKTDPNGSQSCPQRQAHRAGRETPLLPATGCEQSQCATKNADDPKSKESLALDALLPSETALEQERRRRDSNPGWRICNPLP